MLFYCSEHMQKRESNICELDTCSFLRFSLPTNTEPQESAVFNSTEAVHGLPPPKVPSFLISEAYIVKTGRMDDVCSIRPVRGDDCGGCAAIIENYSRREPSEITTS